VSRTELLIALALSAGVLSCTKVSHIDEADVDQVALDLEECIAGGGACTTAGPVTAVESSVPGEHALRVDPGGVVEGPLHRPAPTARLNALIIGFRVIGENGIVREADIGLVDNPNLDPTKYTVPGLVRIRTPNVGYGVIEFSQLDHVPAPKARVHLAGVSGSMEVIFVLGRWYY